MVNSMNTHLTLSLKISLYSIPNEFLTSSNINGIHQKSKSKIYLYWDPGQKKPMKIGGVYRL